MNLKIFRFFLILGFLAGCASNDKKVSGLDAYNLALKKTDPEITGKMISGSHDEQLMLKHFEQFYSDFSEEQIKREVRKLYADNAYFRDGFKEVKGIDNIEEYFLKSVEPVHKCTFDIQDVVVRNGEYYFRWTMNLILKKDIKNTIQTVGMSHVRYNQQGQIIFHQDYWDKSVIFEVQPIIGPIVKWIKNKF